MPQETQLTEEQRARINRAILLEAQGKLTANQQAALNRLRGRGLARPAIQSSKVDLTKTPEHFTGAETGTPPPPEVNVLKRDIGQYEATAKQMQQKVTGLESILPQDPDEIMALVGAGLGAKVGGAATSRILPKALTEVLGASAGAAGGAALAGAGTNVMRGQPVESADVVIDALLNGAIEAAFRGGGKLIKYGAEKFGKRITTEKAGQYLAAEMGGAKKTPAEFGSFVERQTAKATKLAGEQIEAAIPRELRASRPATVTATMAVLDEEIALLERRPDATKEGTKLNALLGTLRRERALIGSPAEIRDVRVTPGIGVAPVSEATGKPTIDDLLQAKSRFAQAAREYDPGEASRISSRLAKAGYEDAMASLGDAAPQAQAAFTRYRQIKDAERAIAELKRNVFAPEGKRPAPAKIVEALNIDPQTSVNALKIITEDSATKAKTIRRALLEDMVARGTLPGVRSDVLDAVFGGDSAKVKRFAGLMDEATQGKSLVGWVTTRLGDIFRLGGRTGTGAQIKYISAREMAAVLDNPIGLAMTENLMRSRITAPQAANSARIFVAILEGIQQSEKRNGGKQE